MQHERITSFPLADASSCDERTAPRFTLLIRAAKLIVPHGEFVCVIRDVSESGISLRGFHSLPSGPQLAIELQTGERHALETVWTRGAELGCRFVTDVSVHDLVAEAGRFPKRQLRLAIAMPIELAFAGRRVHAETLNISQQGARIVSRELLAVDRQVRILAPPLPEIRARVRWRKGEEHGLVFDDTFTLAELALLAATLQDPLLLAKPDCAAFGRR